MKITCLLIHVFACELNMFALSPASLSCIEMNPTLCSSLKFTFPTLPAESMEHHYRPPHFGGGTQPQERLFIS